MKSLDELERAWASVPRPPRGSGAITSICVRRGGGAHALPRTVEITLEDGVVGDRWRLAEDPERVCQVTLMNSTVASLIAHGTRPGSDAGDNFLVDFDLSEDALPVGTELLLGSARCRVSPEPHTGCKNFRERFGVDALRWVNHKNNERLRLRGVNLIVLSSGVASIGDCVRVVD